MGGGTAGGPVLRRDLIARAAFAFDGTCLEDCPVVREATGEVPEYSPVDLRLTVEPAEIHEYPAAEAAAAYVPHAASVTCTDACSWAPP